MVQQGNRTNKDVREKKKEQKVEEKIQKFSHGDEIKDICPIYL